MKESIIKFPEQLRFSPKIENVDCWGKFEKYLLAGMGGSHIQGDILQAVAPSLPLFFHKDYNLPEVFLPNTGIVATSFSGNTEETLSTFYKALSKKLPVIAISKGGQLLEKAKEEKASFIELPAEDIQPRMGLGYSFKALLRATGLKDLEEETYLLADVLEKKETVLQEKGKEVTEKIKEKVPVVYSSFKNRALASFWKINFNETTKIPAFFNVFPELNHNEMIGFDTLSSTKKLSEKMSFVFLFDEEDFPENKKRMNTLKDILEKKGFQVLAIEMEGEKRIEQVFTSILLSSWTSYYLSSYYKTDPNTVLMVEKFKEIIRK